MNLNTKMSNKHEANINVTKEQMIKMEPAVVLTWNVN